MNAVSILGEDDLGNPVPGWCYGHIRWHIPVGWNDYGSDDGNSPIKEFDVYSQVFSIDHNGLLRVEKLDNSVERGTNDVIRLNGGIVPENQLRTPGE